MSHGVEGHTRRGPLTSDDAELVAEVMQALATPSRVLILAQLRESSLSVSELVAAVGMLLAQPQCLAPHLFCLVVLALIPQHPRQVVHGRQCRGMLPAHHHLPQA